MHKVVFFTRKDSRTIKNMINAILKNKKNIASKIKKINYTQSFEKNQENQISKHQEKVIIIFTEKEFENIVLNIIKSFDDCFELFDLQAQN